MTASFAPSMPAQHGPAPARALLVSLAAGLAVLTLFVAGVTFIGLAIAFPIAVPVAAAYHLPVSAADVAIAEGFAEVWWVFGGLAIVSCTAAAVIVFKLINFLSPAPRD